MRFFYLKMHFAKEKLFCFVTKALDMTHHFLKVLNIFGFVEMPSVRSMLGRRHRRRANVDPTLGISTNLKPTIYCDLYENRDHAELHGFKDVYVWGIEESLGLKGLALWVKKWFNLYLAKLMYLNFQPLEVVSRHRDPQHQLVENYSYLFNLSTYLQILMFRHTFHSQ